MDRAIVIDQLKTTEPRLRDLGVSGLYLFGSVARNMARQGSDVDVFIDKQDPVSFGFSQFMAAYDVLREAVHGGDLSYTTRDGLVEFYRQDIEASAIRIF